jgi:hypothetical protein
MTAEETRYHRRQFMGAAAMTVATAQLGMFSSAAESKQSSAPINSTPDKSIGPIKQIEASLLNIGYAESILWRTK